MGFWAHERRVTPPAIKRTAQKKWPLRGAAKFREETPRKGGGFAIEDRNTALQQYAEKHRCMQARQTYFVCHISGQSQGILPQE